MNGRASFGDQSWQGIEQCCGAKFPRSEPPKPKDAMTSGMTAFMVAVGGTSLICCLLMNRVQNRTARRENAGSDGSSTSYGSSDGSSGSGLLSWFGSDSSGDSGGGDSGGGGGD
jgi:hypothetical protein